MADRKSRVFRIKKIELTTLFDQKFDIRDLVADFEYHESIEAAFIRCDINIVDARDFNKGLAGGEIIDIEIETNSGDKKPLKHQLRVYKIGSIIKSKRAAMSRPDKKKEAPKSSSSDDDGTGGKLDALLAKTRGTSSSSSSDSKSYHT